MTLATFPASSLVPRNRDTRLVTSSIVGGRSFGLYQTESDLSGGGIWIDRFDGLHLKSDARRRIIATWATRLRRGQPFIMPTLQDPLNAGQSLAYAKFTSAEFTAAAMLLDTVTASASANAAARATSMSVTIAGAGLIGGERFAINHANWGWRLHEIGTATETADGEYDITFEPGLREAVSVGDALEFNQPKCVMKLMDKESLGAPQVLSLGDTINPVFIEYMGKP